MGDNGVGKSSLIKQYVFKSFGDTLTSKFVAKESLKYLQFKPKGEIGTMNLRLAVKDIGYVRHVQDLDNMMLDDVDGIILVCDLSQEDTFYNFDQWVEFIKELPSLSSIVLAGNKTDLSMRDKVVAGKDLESYAKALKTHSILTSAKTGEGVAEVFMEVARQCLEAELGVSSQFSQAGDAGMASSTGKGGWVGSYTPPAPASAPPLQEMTRAQRNLREMRSKYQQKSAPRGSGQYIDSAGDVHLKYGGFCYLIREEKGEKSFLAFAELMEEGFNGLCIARQYPDEIRDSYDIDETPIYWLTRSGNDKYHMSVNLSRMSSFIKRFLDETEQPVLLIEGLEYLIIQNDFMSVLKFIQLVNEYVRMKHACLILPINPDVLDSKDLSLLEREMVVIDVS
jgi:GTPase SAR1 family protein